MIQVNFEEMERELRSKRELNAVAESPEGKKLAARIDSAALSDAARRGDTAALKSILGQVLSTPEGRALAEKVQKAVGKK